MNRIGLAGCTALLAMGAGGCAVKQYMGISTSLPVTAAEQARLDGALAAAPAGRAEGCPWRAADGATAMIACNALPLPRLAELAGMDHKPALLELGIRFEEGRGVAQDWDKAELAYRRAAWQNSYVAGQQVAGVGAPPGRTFEPLIVPGAPGLESAERRLASLRARKQGR